MQLRKLLWLARSLFLELVAMADHVSSRVSTSCAVLSALLDFDFDFDFDFDAAPTAHTPDRSTVKRLRTALAAQIELRLVYVDEEKREANPRRLFFEVPSRVGMSAAANMRGRERGRPARARKSMAKGPVAVQPPDTGPDARQGIQEKEITP